MNPWHVAGWAVVSVWLWLVLWQLGVWLLEVTR